MKVLFASLMLMQNLILYNMIISLCLYDSIGCCISHWPKQCSKPDFDPLHLGNCCRF